MSPPKNLVIIPARLSSQRLPNKVLLDLAGKPIIQRVYEQAKKAKAIDEVFIATDSQQVQAVCQTFTRNLIMTRPDHPFGYRPYCRGSTVTGGGSNHQCAG